MTRPLHGAGPGLAAPRTADWPPWPGRRQERWGRAASPQTVAGVPAARLGCLSRQAPSRAGRRPAAGDGTFLSYIGSVLAFNQYSVT